MATGSRTSPWCRPYGAVLRGNGDGPFKAPQFIGPFDPSFLPTSGDVGDSTATGSRISQEPAADMTLWEFCLGTATLRFSRSFLPAPGSANSAMR